MPSASPTVVLRADADAGIGTGHVMRCLALALALREAGAAPVFASTPLPAALAARLGGAGFEVAPIARARGSGADARETAALAASRAAAALVIDGYAFAPDYLAACRAAGRVLAVIDDHATAAAPGADITVNQNVYAPPADLVAGLLFGLDFALLRPEFASAREAAGARGRGGVLVTLGGSDPDGLTARIAAAVAAAPCDLDWLFVVGGASPAAPAVAAAIGRGRPGLALAIDPPDMAVRIGGAKLAVVAAGGTMWECLALGTPMFVVHRDAVQKRSVDELRRRDLILGAMAAPAFDGEALLAAVRRAARDPARLDGIARAGMSAVDGAGARRVARAILAAA